MFSFLKRYRADNRLHQFHKVITVS